MITAPATGALDVSTTVPVTLPFNGIAMLILATAAPSATATVPACAGSVTAPDPE